MLYFLKEKIAQPASLTARARADSMTFGDTVARARRLRRPLMVYLAVLYVFCLAYAAGVVLANTANLAHFSRSSCFACVCVRSERGRALVERVECERLYVRFLQKYSSKYFSQSLTFDTSKRILKNGRRCARAFTQT